MRNAWTELEDLFDRIPEPYGQLSSYQRIQITSSPDEVDRETKEVCELIRKCVDMRKKWIDVNEVRHLGLIYHACIVSPC